MSPMGASAAKLGMYVNKGGLQPLEAIFCATRNNAAIFGLEDGICTVEAGKQADPPADTAVLRDRGRIETASKDGRIMPRLPLERSQ